MMLPCALLLLLAAAVPAVLALQCATVSGVCQPAPVGPVAGTSTCVTCPVFTVCEVMTALTPCAPFCRGAVARRAAYDLACAVTWTPKIIVGAQRACERECATTRATLYSQGLSRAPGGLVAKAALHVECDAAGARSTFVAFEEDAACPPLRPFVPPPAPAAPLVRQAAAADDGALRLRTTVRDGEDYCAARVIFSDHFP